MNYKLVEKLTGKIINSGNIITDFRGDNAEFIDITRYPEVGKSGKIYVKVNGSGREYYPHVFGCEIKEA